MSTKVLNYNEIGIVPRIRESRLRAINNRQSIKNEYVWDTLKEMIKNPAYVENYELKLAAKYGY